MITVLVALKQSRPEPDVGLNADVKLERHTEGESGKKKKVAE